MIGEYYKHVLSVICMALSSKLSKESSLSPFAIEIRKHFTSQPYNPCAQGKGKNWAYAQGLKTDA